jgi:hypothetical protein
MTGRAATAAALLALLAGCTRDAPPGDWPPADPYPATTTGFAPVPTNKIDLLFMVDNSSSPEAAQAPLRAYFPNFIRPLLRFDLHVGIITSDLGAGVFTPPSCDTVGGDQGLLQNTPQPGFCATASLVDPGDRFLQLAPDPDGGAPTANFTGDIGDAFVCYLRHLGTAGCGYEHQLASVRAALAGCDVPGGCTQPANEGFLRPDALLAVLIFTDEDDCSAPPDSRLFDTSQTSLEAELGPLTSYRCFEFGTLCYGAGRTPGRRDGCEPGNQDPDPHHQLIPVGEIADFLKWLKADPRMVHVTVVAGPPTPVQVGLDANGYPDLTPSCTGGSGAADPAIRLAAFTEHFDPDRAQFLSACTEPSLLMQEASRGVRRAVDLHCLAPSPPLRDRDSHLPGVQPDCAVEDRVPRADASGAYDPRVVPSCDPPVCDSATVSDCRCARHELAPGTPGCWFVWSDPTECPGPDLDLPPDRLTLRFAVDRGTDEGCTTPPAPAGTVTVVQCVTCAADPAAGVFDCSPGCARHWPDRCPADAGAGT